MSQVKITGPGGGEVALSGPATVRILEDGGPGCEQAVRERAR